MEVEQIDQKCELNPDASIDEPNSSFDCNICLDAANEPIVTLCGHLYCWSCIYKWLLVRNTSLPSEGHPQCPVCKAEISQATAVPLYGRGRSASNPEHEIKDPSRGAGIPPRPPACWICTQALPDQNPYQLPYV